MSTQPTTKEDALKQILQTMDGMGLTLKDVREAFKDHQKKKQETARGLSRSEMIMRLFSYIGGAFIFAGLGTYIYMVWDDLQSLPRVIITLGSGFVAFILGILFVKNEKLQKAATPAHIVAFLLQPTGLFVLLHEYSSGGNVHLATMFVFGLLTIQQVFTFAAFRRTSLAFFSIMYFLGFIGGLIEYMEFHRAFSMLVVGTGFFFLTVDLTKREQYKDLTPFFYVLSTAMLYSGLYYYTGNTIYDPVNLSVSLGLLMLAVLQNSRTLYILGILYIITYLTHGPGGGWYEWDTHNDWSTTFGGVSVILAGLWLRKAAFTAATPLWFFFGMGFALGGAFGVVFETPFEVLFIGLTCLAIYASLTMKSRAALAVSVISLISYISHFTHEHFKDVTGWPLLLVLLGFMLLGAGYVFVRLSKKIEKSKS